MPHWGILNGAMPQSFSAVYVHPVFSTTDRRPLLRDKPTRDALHAYLGGVSKQLDCPPPRELERAVYGASTSAFQPVQERFQARSPSHVKRRGTPHYGARLW